MLANLDIVTILTGQASMGESCFYSGAWFYPNLQLESPSSLSTFPVRPIKMFESLCCHVQRLLEDVHLETNRKKVE
jgi:hypothetical protein